MKYRKKPVVVEAERFLPDELPLPFRSEGVCCLNEKGWYIKTLEGDLKLTDGNFVIRGVKGEFYPCKPDVFGATYEAVEEESNS